ncbi:MAG: hypothetical protein WKG06_01210 [Segetibacter sp.]
MCGLAHIDTLPPDVVSLRKEALPLTGSQDKRASEMNIPEWVVTVIYKCLHKKPQNRFSNGIELNNFITQNSLHVLNADNTSAQSSLIVQEKQQLQKQLLLYTEELNVKEKEFEELQTKANNKNTELQLLEVKASPDSFDEKGVAKSSFIALLFLSIALAAFSAYSYFKNSRRSQELTSNLAKDKVNPNNNFPAVFKKTNQKKKQTAVNKKIATDTNASDNELKKSIKRLPQQPAADKKEISGDNSNQEKSNKSVQYTVISKAYFHNTPDESTRREAYINHWNNAVLTPSDDINGFIYIVYTNHKGQTSRGWLRKKDLKPLE